MISGKSILDAFGGSQFYEFHAQTLNPNNMHISLYARSVQGLASRTGYSELPLFRPLNCGHLDIAATYLGTDLKLHQDCTNLVSDLRSPRYSVLQPLLEIPILAIVFILQPEMMFVGVVMIKT